MSKLEQRPAVLEDAPVYHYPDGDPRETPVFDGVQCCGVAASVYQGHLDYFDVAPGRALPAGARWATVAELDDIHRTHPAATDRQLYELAHLGAELRAALTTENPR